MLKTIEESEITKIGRRVTQVDYGYIDHAKTTCCMCGSKETRIQPNGRLHWLKHKVDIDKKFDPNGNWDDKYYIWMKA